MNIPQSNTMTAWKLLYYTYGIIPIVAGVDKFFNFLTYWPSYLNPAFAKLLPISPLDFMHVVGVIEILAGIIVLVQPRKGGYVVAAWLVAIALNLLAMGHGYMDIAVRDIAMAIGAYVLVLLSKTLDK